MLNVPTVTNAQRKDETIPYPKLPISDDAPRTPSQSEKHSKPTLSPNVPNSGRRRMPLASLLATPPRAGYLESMHSIFIRSSPRSPNVLAVGAGQLESSPSDLPPLRPLSPKVTINRGSPNRRIPKKSE